MDTQDIPSGPLVGKALLYFTSIFVSLGVFIFGYDQGVMSGVITGPYFKLYFNNPSSSTIGTTVAILEVGALISSLYVGHIGDVIGRRRTIRYGALIFVVGGAFQTCAKSIHGMILGRIISGVGVGLLSTIVPVYQSEISPPHNRGKLACIEFTGNIIGYASSVWTDYFCTFIESDLSWRVPLFVQCVFGFFLLLGSFVIVESPRWLLDHDHDAEGIVVIADLYSDGDVHADNAREEFRSIKESVLMGRMEGEKSYSEMFRRYSTRLFIAMSAQMFAQFNGINVISYYAPLVFEQAGWLGRDAILMTGFNGIVYILSTIPPWYLVDNWGRRPILVSGGILMALSLFMVSYVSYLDIPNTPALVVIFVIIYNAGFGFSWGPIPWLFPPEILPLSVRAKGASMSTATNWAANFVVGQLAPVLLEKIKWKLYLIHTTSCILSVITVLTVYPETSGLQLEDMDSLFDDRSSTFSYQNGTSYGAVDEEAAGGSRFVSAAAMARHPIGEVGSHSQLMPSSSASIKSQTAPSPMIQPQDVEPPDLASILAYKNSDQNSIRGSLRRGSEAVSSIFRFGKKDGDNESTFESDDQS